jgi:hypothetical protein
MDRIGDMQFALVQDGFDSSGAAFEVRLEREGDEVHADHILDVGVDGFNIWEPTVRQENYFFGDRLDTGISAVGYSGWQVGCGVKVPFRFVDSYNRFSPSVGMCSDSENFRSVTARIFLLNEEGKKHLTEDVSLFPIEMVDLLETLEVRWISERRFQEAQAKAAQKV